MKEEGGRRKEVKISPLRVSVEILLFNAIAATGFVSSYNDIL